MMRASRPRLGGRVVIVVIKVARSILASASSDQAFCLSGSGVGFARPGYPKTMDEKHDYPPADLAQPAIVAGQGRVLLVEDDRSVRRYLQVTLERAGYEVLTASDGLEDMKLA